jgi:hypothetical protein
MLANHTRISDVFHFIIIIIIIYIIIIIIISFLRE